MCYSDNGSGNTGDDNGTENGNGNRGNMNGGQNGNVNRGSDNGNRNGKIIFIHPFMVRFSTSPTFLEETIVFFQEMATLVTLMVK